MSYYMTQFSYTTAAWQALIRNPEDRQAVVGTLVKRLGGNLLSMYYTMGDYDGFIITEAPDDETAGAAVLTAIGTGHVSNIKTTKLFDMGEMIAMLQKAGGQSYAAPEG
jgi:uncharacterized protein with GYD domain